MSDRLSESTVESAALAWPKGLGWGIKHGPEIVPAELFAEREDCRQEMLERKLRDALLSKLIFGELSAPDVEKILEGTS